MQIEHIHFSSFDLFILHHATYSYRFPLHGYSSFPLSKKDLSTLKIIARIEEKFQYTEILNIIQRKQKLRKSSNDSDKYSGENSLS